MEYARVAADFTAPSRSIASPADRLRSKSRCSSTSRRPMTDGEERGVYIHLGGADQSGRSIWPGRNSAPEAGAYSCQAGQSTYSANNLRATRYSGSGALKVSFQERITTEPGKTPRQSNSEHPAAGRRRTRSCRATTTSRTRRVRGGVSEARRIQQRSRRPSRAVLGRSRR